MSTHLIALALAVIIDRIIGDPRWLPHPVVGFGKLIAFFDRRFNDGNYRRAKGLLMLVLVLLIVVFLAVVIISLSYSVHLYLGILVEAWLISTTIAAKGLKQAANEVREPLVNGNLEEARLKVSYIVGRDTDDLNEAEITRATVETVAENTSDGVTAPLFFALIGGAPLALIYRAINTCDSMVGYQNKKYGDFGFASAKCDDLFNWIPSRLTSLVMIAVNQPKHHKSKKACWEIVKRDAPKHPSPNSGWGEAAVAALLGIQLGGINTYKGITSNRAKMGDPLVTMSAVHIEETNAIMLRTTTAFSLILIACGGVIIVLT